jgi:hypothetical protein
MSFGIKVGRAIGAGAALVVEGSVRGATGLGRFGNDVVTGAEQGYEERSAQLRITREAARVKREAQLAAMKAAHTEALAAPATPVEVAAPIATKRTARA